tara:strand:+ start:61 stop:390 length:330 start_codon:yes stop_codon:yes gene_type:complete
MGHYKGYSGGNHHLRMDMDHERRLIHDAKDAIYDEDRKLRDRKAAAHKDGDYMAKRGDYMAKRGMDHMAKKDYMAKRESDEDISLEGGNRPVDADATVMDNKREDKFKK